MTVVQLRERAKRKGLKGYSKLRKDELVSLLASVSNRKAIEIRQIDFPEHDAFLFLVKDPGALNYTQTYVYGQRALDHHRFELLRYVSGKKFDFYPTPVSFLETHGIPIRVASGIGSIKKHAVSKRK